MSLISIKLAKNLQSKYIASTVYSSIKCLSSTHSFKEQLDQYDQNGFFVVRQLVKSETLEKYRKRFQKICSEKIKIPGYRDEIYLLFKWHSK